MNLVAIDAELTLVINHLHSLWWDNFFYTYTQAGIWIPIYLLFAYFFLKERTKEGIILILMAAVVAGTTNWFSSEMCKPFFHRFRPTHDPNISELIWCVKGYRGGLYGFISSHAANCFALTTFFALVFRKKSVTITLVCWASLNAYSRVYLGVHFVGDIVCGTLAGVCIAYSYYILLRKYSYSHSDKVQFPRPIRPVEEKMLITLYVLLCLICAGTATYAVFQEV